MNNYQNWSDSELKETIKAYLWMLECEQKKKKYNKSAVNYKLRGSILASRTQGSIEYRMENISAALAELCLPWIKGYKPHSNIGSKVKERIINILDELGVINKDDYRLTAQDNELNNSVRKLMYKELVGKPKGNKFPDKINIKSAQYVRDPLVKTWVLKNADGICELCMSNAPFIMDDGTPYLEVHHIIALSNGGEDTISNTVALCPNCHKKCHFAADRDITTNNLINKIIRLDKLHQ